MAAPTAGVDKASYRRLMVALEKADRETRRDALQGIRRGVEPVRTDAQKLAVRRIDRVGRPWSRMRSKVTRKSAYVMPVERGVRTRGRARYRRPNLARLLAKRAMEPALAKNAAAVTRAVERELNKTIDRFNRGR